VQRVTAKDVMRGLDPTRGKVFKSIQVCFNETTVNASANCVFEGFSVSESLITENKFVIDRLRRIACALLMWKERMKESSEKTVIANWRSNASADHMTGRASTLSTLLESGKLTERIGTRIPSPLRRSYTTAAVKTSQGLESPISYQRKDIVQSLKDTVQYKSVKHGRIPRLPPFTDFAAQWDQSKRIDQLKQINSDLRSFVPVSASSNCYRSVKDSQDGDDRKVSITDNSSELTDSFRDEGDLF